MLVSSQIKDLFAGRLSDQLARQCLLDLNSQKPSAALINELIKNIQEINDNALIESLLQSMAGIHDLIDCCGTGGTGIPRYNTSTSVSFILAAGGLKVAKCGNRSASSTSGSFDFLESLGIPVSLPLPRVSDLFEKTNLIFLFAPQFYPVLAKLAPIRKTITGPTIFNLIGTLLNPLNPAFRLLGSATKASQQAMADYLLAYTDNTKSLVVCAASGMDELDPLSNNSILTVENSSITETILQASNRELPTIFLPGTTQDNARLFNEMINNFSSIPLYLQSLVTLNAGAGFLLAGKVSNLEEGQQLAASLLSSGEVSAKYEQLRRLYAKYTQ